MPNASYGDATKGRAKQLLDALLAYVDGELDEFEGIDITHRWQKDEGQTPKLIVETQRRTLEFLTAKDPRYPGQLVADQVRQTLTTYLGDFLEILEDNRGKTKGKDEWHFTLKLWSKDREENLAAFERLWEEKRPDKSKPSPPPPAGIDWQKICADILAETQATRRHQATGWGMGHEVNIYVPLGLLKPKQTPRRNADAELSMQQNQLPEDIEIEKRYEYQEFLDEIIGQVGKNLAIVGEPGAGKTTWLDKISEEARKNFYVIWIPLANLGGLTIEQYLLTKWLKDGLRCLEPTKEQKQALMDLFYSGKIWLLLDGVDEIKTEFFPLTHINQSLTGWVSKARVVLTCRLNLWEANPNALPQFESYRTLDFNQEQIESFIAQWFSKTKKPGLGEELWEKLKEDNNYRLLDFVKNPLILSLLCKSWWLNPDEISTTKAQLYQQFRDNFYSWKQEKFPTTCSQRQELNKRLAKLAFRVIDENIPLRESLVHDVLEEYFTLAEKLSWLTFAYRDVRTDEGCISIWRIVDMYLPSFGHQRLSYLP